MIKRVYVWEFPVRLVHFFNFWCVGMLSVTGYYIGTPFMYALNEHEFIMSDMRFVHFVSAYVFTAILFIRIYWLFAGNQYAHWKTIVPITKRQWKKIADQALFYAFLKKKEPRVTGHTGLAALSYIVLFIFFLIQILTGFALYSMSHSGKAGDSWRLAPSCFQRRIYSADSSPDHVDHRSSSWASTSTWDGTTISAKSPGPRARSSADTRALMKNKILLIGLGNILLTDEGVGVHAIHHLKERYHFNPPVEIVDGGTLGLDLLPFLENCDSVLFVDAIDFGKEPGYIGEIEDGEIPSADSNKTFRSPYRPFRSPPCSRWMDMKPDKICLIGIQPESLAMGLELSELIKSKMEELVERVIKRLETWGVTCVSPSP